MDLSGLDCHQNWVKQLGASFDASRTRRIEDHAIVEMHSSYCVQSYAHALLVYLYTESGNLQKAESLFERNLEDIYTQSSSEGCSYLLGALRIFVLRKEGKAREARELLETVSKMGSNLNNKDQAYLYGAKSYALSRLNQGRFCSSIVESLQMATVLCPESNSHKLSYAIALGRQRRWLRSARYKDNVQSIENEQKLLEPCINDTGPLSNLARSFSIFLKQESVEMMIRHGPKLKSQEFWETVNRKNKELYLDLDILYKEYKGWRINYDQVVITKRMAMTYGRLSQLPVKRFPNKRTCSQRADELFKVGIKITTQFQSYVGFQQLAVEYGKFCELCGYYDKAMAFYKRCWEEIKFGEGMFRYIHCRRKIKGDNYDPILDIAEGIQQVDQEDCKSLVILLCLRGDYFESCKKDTENAIESWMDALKSDPWGKFMRQVPSHWGKWSPGSSSRPVDYRRTLFDVIDKNLNEYKKSDNHVMQITYLSHLAKYHEMKEPQDLSRAKKLLGNALELAKEFGKSEKEQEIMDQVNSLIASKAKIDDFESNFRKNYKDITKIGSGGFGAVFKATHCVDGMHYAVKAVRDNDASVRTEVFALSNLDHKHVVRYYNSWIEYPPSEWADFYLFTSSSGNYSSDITATEENFLSEKLESLSLESEISNTSSSTEGIMYIQMELCEMSLRTWMNDHEDEKCLPVIHNIFMQCVDALVYIHDQGYTHKDLKPTNIFVNTIDTLNLTAKIGDFGLAKYVEEGERLHYPTTRGAIDYRAPELIKGQPYDNKVDVYALALILFELLECTCENRVLRLLNLRKNQYPPGFESSYKEEHSILSKMLEEEPSCRLSASDIKQLSKNMAFK